MEHTKKLKISLACISAIFFFMVLFYGLTISGFSERIVSSDVAYLWLGLTLLLGVISLIGAIIFLSDIRKMSVKWYLGVPLLSVMFTIVVTSIFLLYYVTSLPIDPAEPVGFIHMASLLALAPASIPFFFSFPDSSDVRYISGVLAGFMSIFAVADLFFIIKDVFLYPIPCSNALAVGFVYYLIGVSMIGFCFLLLAKKFHRKNYMPISKQDEIGGKN
ncbi:hypothetical protein [Methanococcoides sp. LMO-2]|uniref:DUF1109 domain-containing protein n=1 Tax=Methanococcoides cohabitans TaxID=3136559 RepID=A0ABU9KTE8_9EURY